MGRNFLRLFLPPMTGVCNGVHFSAWGRGGGLCRIEPGTVTSTWTLRILHFRPTCKGWVHCLELLIRQWCTRYWLRNGWPLHPEHASKWCQIRSVSGRYRMRTSFCRLRMCCSTGPFRSDRGASWSANPRRKANITQWNPLLVQGKLRLAHTLLLPKGTLILPHGG